MNMLIVDDDFHVIQGIQQNIHWESTEIEHVFYALGVTAAKQMFLRHGIDIVICDIEMPRETGLDFVDWMRKKHFKVQVIFLTGYAKFEYAHKAIELGGLEYILKPVDYNMLEQAIGKAVKNAVRIKENERMKQSDQYWEQNKQKVKEHFWNGIITGNIFKSGKSLDSFIDECGLSYIREMIFLPIVVQSDTPEISADICIEKTIIEVCSELEQTGKELSCIFFEIRRRISDSSAAFVLKAYMNTENSKLETAVRYLAEKLDKCLKVRKEKFFLGIGMWSVIDLVFDDIQNINIMMMDAPRNDQNIVFLESYQPVDMPRIYPDTSMWTRFLMEGRTEELKKMVRQFLEELEGKNHLSSRNLQQFGIDITQMVYSYLDSVNVYAHLLFDNEENVKLYGKAALSVHNMLEYVDYLLSKASNYNAESEETSDFADKIKEYIDNHFQRNLTREELSRLVFLNPDYLSRIFKKKMGMSISSYIILKRIDEAKKLLISTNIPVSVISAQVGYDNFAYFTKIFKDKTGMTPNEYRKHYKK